MKKIPQTITSLKPKGLQIVRKKEKKDYCTHETLNLTCLHNSAQSPSPCTAFFPVPLGRLDHVTQHALAARNNEA